MADITCIWTREGWLYLATNMDLFSRKIIGWSLRERLTKELVIAALDMALKQRTLPADLLIHSDRGSQYVSKLYQLILLKRGIICSIDYFYRVYLQFNLDAIPADAVIVNADLKLYQPAAIVTVDLTIDLHQVIENWEENMITWDNQPDYLVTPESTIKTEFESW